MYNRVILGSLYPHYRGNAGGLHWTPIERKLSKREWKDGTIAVREDKERSAVDKVKSAYGEKYDPTLMHDSKRDVANLLHEEAETHSIRERLRQKQQQQARQKKNKKKKMSSTNF